MKRKLGFILALSLACLVARADEATQEAQRVLKEQGFYYGEITGAKDADTTAAIRRYQIRNGLQVTGELNDETNTALRSAPKNSTPVAVASATPSARTFSNARPAATPPQPAVEDSSDADVQPRTFQPPTPNITMVPNQTPRTTGAGLFANTPYEAAPPEIQRNVIASAQTVLARRGFYRSGVDGAFGPSTEFALRAYQSQLSLQPTGVFDMDTLAAMQLLPGQRNFARPVMPPRRIAPPPVVRGEWIRD